MAGPIRQPINLDNLSKYIDQHAPEIKTPLDVKQVAPPGTSLTYLLLHLSAARPTLTPLFTT